GKRKERGARGERVGGRSAPAGRARIAQRFRTMGGSALDSSRACRAATRPVIAPRTRIVATKAHSSDVEPFASYQKALNQLLMTRSPAGWSPSRLKKRRNNLPVHPCTPRAATEDRCRRPALVASRTESCAAAVGPGRGPRALACKLPEARWR